VVLGDPRAEGVTMGPLVSLEQRDEVLRQVQALVDGGGRIVIGAPESTPEVHSDSGSGPAAEGAFVAPMLLRFDDARADAVNTVEAFGPVSSLITYATVAEASDIVARGGGSLVTSVATHDPAFAAEIMAGAAAWNGRVLFLDRDDARSSTGHG